MLFKCSQFPSYKRSANGRLIVTNLIHYYHLSSNETRQIGPCFFRPLSLSWLVIRFCTALSPAASSSKPVSSNVLWNLHKVSLPVPPTKFPFITPKISIHVSQNVNTLRYIRFRFYFYCMHCTLCHLIFLSSLA